MNKIALLTCAALLLSCSCEKQEVRDQDQVDAYVAALLDGTFKPDIIQMKLFDPEAIPALLSYADDKREIPFPPVCPLSSALVSSCTVGIYMLWTVEGIRLANGGGGRAEKLGGYPSLTPTIKSTTALESDEEPTDVQAVASRAYRAWWASGPFTRIVHQDPLDGTGYRW